MLCNIYISQNSSSVKTALSEQLCPEPRMGNSSEKVNILRPRILLDISPKNETKPLDQTTFEKHRKWGGVLVSTPTALCRMLWVRVDVFTLQWCVSCISSLMAWQVLQQLDYLVRPRSLSLTRTPRLGSVSVNAYIRYQKSDRVPISDTSSIKQLMLLNS